MVNFNWVSLLIVPCCVTVCLGSGWQGKDVEVYFVLDASSSMWGREFRNMTRMVADIVGEMDINSGRARVGLGLFSDHFVPHIPLRNNYSKEDLLEAILTTPHIRGNTFLSRGIEGMRRELAIDRTRPNVPRIGVFITDGRARYKWQTYMNSTMAKREGIFVFAIGVGQGIKTSEIADLASDPKRDYQFFAPNFDQLGSLTRTLSEKMAKVDLYLNDQGTCGEHTQVDTTFVYDEWALGAALMRGVKTFLKEVTDDLRINPGNIRVGVMSRSNTCRRGNVIKMGDFVTREEIMQTVDRFNTESSIDRLVAETRNRYYNFEAGHRRGVKKRMVVIISSDLGPRVRRELNKQMFITKFNDIEMFIIRHGSDYDKGSLQMMASSPDHVVFSDIQNASAPFLRIFCRDI